jgi:hypothetical protein
VLVCISHKRFNHGDTETQSRLLITELIEELDFKEFRKAGKMISGIFSAE